MQSGNFFHFKKKIAVWARQHAFFSHMVSPFGSAPRLMEPVMQEGKIEYWMPEAFMTLFLDFIMNKWALSLGGRIPLSKMVSSLNDPNGPALCPYLLSFYAQRYTNMHIVAYTQIRTHKCNQYAELVRNETKDFIPLLTWKSHSGPFFSSIIARGCFLGPCLYL